MTERTHGAAPVPESPARIGVPDPGDVLRRATSAVGRPLRDLVVLPGGTSSITYSARLPSDDRVVVKVAPPGLDPVRNRDVLRQVRVLRALADVPGVAVPAVVGTDAGQPPMTPPLFVMTFVPGESYEPRHDPAPAHMPTDAARARATAAARMLAALHAVVPDRVGLDEPPVALTAEVERWSAAFATCALDPAIAGATHRCRVRLMAAVPRQRGPAVLHGDWRLGNMQCFDAEIHAVIDWEMWSIGDPRLDLAWMRLMSDPAHPNAAAADAPTLEPDELLATYEDADDRVSDIGWFDALVRYKQAAASALLVKNAERRGVVTDRTRAMQRGVPLLLDAALTCTRKD